jgi:hypothetical protein
MTEEQSRRARERHDRRLRSIEVQMPKGTAQMADPWTLLDVPGIKAWSLTAGFDRCDYLTLTGTTEAVMRAARAAGATETDLMEALLDD